ncbi:hypothetical protein Lal_00039407 [Lupinus albus]|nr:hypothetical protein Lal_00039407 [Lupinus albus]
MHPKAANKDLDENILQIFAEKLQENKDQQDARHEAIADALRSITDKLAGLLPEIRWELSILQPKNIVEALGLAKLTIAYN